MRIISLGSDKTIKIISASFLVIVSNCIGVIPAYAGQTVTVYDVLVATETLTIIGTTTLQGSAFSVGGSSLVVANGNVGIGTTVPQALLDVEGGNIRLSTTTNSAGAVYSGSNLYIHNFGSENTFMGVRAGNLSLTGGDNTGIGYQALTSDTGGYRNTAIGSGALYPNTGGTENTAVGMDALASDGGDDNTAIGNSALTNDTDSNDNTSIGAASAELISDDLLNTAVGVSAMGNNSSGDENVAIGALAMEGFFAGSGNTAVGSAAGSLYGGTTTLNGSNNTFIGYEAQAGANVSNSAAIGYGAIVSKNNAIVLGGIYPFFGVNIGVGTSSPTATLDIVGSAQFGDAATRSTFTETGALNVFSTVTASAFIGNGTYLTFSSVTASTFIGDGTHLTFASTTTIGNLTYTTAMNYSAPLINSEWSLGISQHITSAVNSLSFANFLSTTPGSCGNALPEYKIHFNVQLGGSNAQWQLRFSTGATAAFDATTSNYAYNEMSEGAGSGTAAATSGTACRIGRTAAANLNGEVLEGDFFFAPRPGNDHRVGGFYQGRAHAALDATQSHLIVMNECDWGFTTNIGPLYGVEFLTSAGNYTGDIQIYYKCVQ